MVRQERDRRGPQPGGDPEGSRHLTDRAAGLQARAERWADEAQVRPGFRERVEELMRVRWQEPVIVLRLGDTDLGFDVPGRRNDGSVEGEQLGRQAFRNLLRGVGTAVFSVFALANGGAPGRLSQREVRVSGPADAMALEPADQLRTAKGPWLVCAPSGVAVVDTGTTFTDPADAPEPQVVWAARGPQAPALSLRKRTLTWPDGSVLRFPLHGRTEDQHLKKFLEFPDVVHWTGRPG